MGWSDGYLEHLGKARRVMMFYVVLRLGSLVIPLAQGCLEWKGRRCKQHTVPTLLGAWASADHKKEWVRKRKSKDESLCSLIITQHSLLCQPSTRELARRQNLTENPFIQFHTYVKSYLQQIILLLKFRFLRVTSL